MRDLARMKPANSTAIVELFGKYHTTKDLIIRDPYYVSNWFVVTGGQRDQLIIGDIYKYKTQVSIFI